MAPSPVAEAFVLVRPDLTGFAATLQAEVTKAVQQVKVPRLTVQANVQAQAQAATNAVAAQAGKQAKAATGSADAVAKAAKVKVAAEQQVTAAVTAETAALERLAVVQAAGAEAGARLSAFAVASAKAQAEAQARAAAAASAGAQAGARLSALAVANAEAQAVAAQKVATVFKALRTEGVAAAQAFAQAQQIVAAGQAEVVSASNAATASLSRQAKQAKATGIAAVESANATAVANERVRRGLERARARSVAAGGIAAVATQDNAQALAAAAAEKAARLAAIEEEQRLSVQRRSMAVVTTAQTEAEERLAGVRTAGAAATTAVGRAQAQVVAAGAAAAAAQDLVNTAQAKGIPTAEALGVAYRTEARSLLQLAEAELLQAKAAQVSSRSTSQAARGAAATAASFAGLRGATLAATGPFIAASVAVTVLGKALGAGANLEEQLNVFAATTGATADQMKRVSDAAVALGRDITLPGVSAGDAAKTMTELSKAGLSVTDSISGARGVLLLATAAQIDFSQASELAASALNSFGLQGDQAGRVADVFAGAANAAQGSIQDFALANQQVDAVARQVGLSLEDTTALLAELARNGLRGSDAGTSLRTALVRLIAPTREARQLLDQLGISIRDAQGNIDPLVFARFGEATAGLAPDLRDTITAAIFGQDAIRAVAIAAREGEDGFLRMKAAVEASGGAQKLADARAQGLKGALGGLASNAETLGTQLTSKVIPALTSVVRFTGEFVAAASQLVGAINSVTGAVGGLVSKIPGVDLFSGALGKAVKYGPAFGPFLGAAKILDAFTTSAEEAAAAAAKLQAQVQAAQDAAATFSGTGQLEAIGAAQQGALEARNKKILELVGQLNTTLSQFANSGLASEQVRDSVLAIVDQLKSIGGPAVQEALRQNMGDIAGILGEEVRAISEEFGVSLDDLTTKVPQTLRNLINRLAQSAEGRDILKKFGNQLSESLADGIDEGSIKAEQAARKAVANAAKAAQNAQENAQEAVVQAGKNLANAIEQANNNLIASVSQGRNNLRTVGDEFASQIAALVDVGPLAQKAKALTKELDKVDARLEEFRRSTQQGNLERGLTDAQTALDRQRDSLITLGQGLSGAQKAKLGDLLAPAQQKVDDATAALQEFNLEGKKDTLAGKISDVQALQEAAKTAATDGVAALVTQLQIGAIDADTFAGRLRALVEGPLKTLKGKDGKNLGLRFSTEFLGNLQTIIGQAQALAQFVSIPSPSAVVDPAVTRRQGRENIADTRAAGQESIADARSRAAESRAAVAEAQANLNKTITENATNQKKTATNTEKMVNLLAVISKALEPKQPNTTKTGGPTRDNNASVKGSKVKGG